MKEVVESNNMATGEKEKNILTGAYDIISAIDFVNKNRKPAYMGSYDMVKAYDRAMISFLLRVMERMGTVGQITESHGLNSRKCANSTNI